MKNFLKKLQKNSLALSVSLFILTFFVVGTNLDKPFIGIHDWNGAKYGVIARNYLRGEMGEIDTHYPALLPLLIAGSYKIFGVSEFATRIVPTLATSLMIVEIFFIGSLLYNKEVGFFASLFALATPVVRYFGKNPVHEPLVIAFVLLAFLGIIGKRIYLVIVGLILAEFTTWSGYLAVPILAALLFKDKNTKRYSYFVVGISVFLFLLHFVITKAQTGSPFGGGLAEIFFYRLGSSEQFSMLEFFLRIKEWGVPLLTLSLILASTIFFLKLIKEKKITRNDFIILSLGLWGISYPLIFRNATYIHNYFVIYLLPFLSLSASVGLFWLLKKKESTMVLAISIVFLIAIERKDFLMALTKSRGDKLAYKAATFAGQVVSKNESIAPVPKDYAISRRPILTFYSDRKIVIEGKADWILKIDETKGTYNLIKI